MKQSVKRTVGNAAILALPWLAALAVWLSALAFVPVPWPDDSAFYFVGRELFKWPPRWVMLPQAPFEPSYAIWNFNTMPLYPILLGLGRFIGIDGSFALKLWPLSAWAASGSLLAWALLREKLPRALVLLITFAVALDPILRWASVVVRPESLIGLFGLALVLGLARGYPTRLRPRRYWDPTAALLAFAAYAHFNAIHLVVPVALALWRQPRKLARIAALTALYLTPWLATIARHPAIFARQMTMQWTRLSAPNLWLESPRSAIAALFPDMGSPDGWPAVLHLTGLGLWLLIALAGATVFATILTRTLGLDPRASRRLAPAAGWVLGAAWLWHAKPEVWFIYYLHLAALVFAALLALTLWEWTRSPRETERVFGTFGLAALGVMLAATTGVFGLVDATQARALHRTRSWHWSTYREFVDCIESGLLEPARRHPERPFRVWLPTFPDVTIELARRHPDWELTRTNDFWERNRLALQHASDVDAVVVTETLNWEDREITASLAKYPEVQSRWMSWQEGYLYELLDDARWPGWKPERFLCQRGRWQAFIYLGVSPQ
jgi:hypothetical protein